MAVTTITGVGTPNKVHFYEAALSNTAVPVFTDGRWVQNIIIEGGAAAEIVIFRAIADTPVWFRVPVGIAGSVVLTFSGRGLFLPGLEVITASAAGDVGVAIFYA